MPNAQMFELAQRHRFDVQKALADGVPYHEILDYLRAIDIPEPIIEGQGLMGDITRPLDETRDIMRSEQEEALEKMGGFSFGEGKTAQEHERSNIGALGGALQYAQAPVTAVGQAVFNRPVERAATTMGASEPVAGFLGDTAEFLSYIGAGADPTDVAMPLIRNLRAMARTGQKGLQKANKILTKKYPQFKLGEAGEFDLSKALPGDIVTLLGGAKKEAKLIEKKKGGWDLEFKNTQGKPMQMYVPESEIHRRVKRIGTGGVEDLPESIL